MSKQFLDDKVLKISFLEYFLNKKVQDMEELVLIYNKQLQIQNSAMKDQEAVKRYKKNIKNKKLK
jgi:hypothetical protein